MLAKSLRILGSLRHEANYMRRTSTRSNSSFAICAFVFLAVHNPAPSAGFVLPNTQEELDKSSEVIVTGEITDLTVTVPKDGSFAMRLQITSVIKGVGIKAGDTLNLESESPEFEVPKSKRFGSQGLTPLPKKGDFVTAYLRKMRDYKPGIRYSPLIPNGMPLTTPPTENSAGTVVPAPIVPSAR
jgi:hypothetical protein